MVHAPDAKFCDEPLPVASYRGRKSRGGYRLAGALFATVASRGSRVCLPVCFVRAAFPPQAVSIDVYVEAEVGLFLFLLATATGRAHREFQL